MKKSILSQSSRPYNKASAQTSLPKYTNPFQTKPRAAQPNEEEIPEYQISDNSPTDNGYQLAPTTFPMLAESDTPVTSMNQLILDYKSKATTQYIPQKLMELQDKFLYAQQKYTRDFEENKVDINSLTELTSNLYANVESMKKEIESLKEVITNKDSEIEELNGGTEDRQWNSKSRSSKKGAQNNYIKSRKYSEEIDEMINEWAQKEAGYKDKIAKLEGSVSEIKTEKEQMQQSISLHSKEKANFNAQQLQNEEKYQDLDKKMKALQLKYKEEKVSVVT
jgi:hypothetical protein